jgi:hypothetical protein
MAIKKTADEQKYGLKTGASQAAINAAKVREANRMQTVPPVTTASPSRTMNIGGQQVTATTLGQNQTFDPSKAARTGATLVSGRTQTVPPVTTPGTTPSKSTIDNSQQSMINNLKAQGLSAGQIVEILKDEGFKGSEFSNALKLGGITNKSTGMNTYTSGGKTFTAPAGSAADKLYSSKYQATPMGITRTDEFTNKTPSIVEIGGTPKFQVDPEKEKLVIRAEGRDPSLTEEEKALAQEYLIDQVVYNRTIDPNAGADRVQKSYDRIQEEYQRQIKEAERQKQIESERMAAERGDRVDQFVSNQNVIYEPEVKAAQAQGEVQKESVRQILSFSGFGRSTKTVEKLTEVDQNVDQRLRAIEGVKQAEAMRYQAQLEGADAMALSEMDKGIRDLRDKSNQLNLDSMVKIEELKLEAQQKGDEMAMEQLGKLQASFMEDLNAFDQEMSKANGFLTSKDPVEIGNQIAELFSNPAIRNAASQSALNSSAISNQVKKMTPAHIQVYKNLLVKK